MKLLTLLKRPKSSLLNIVVIAVFLLIPFTLLAQSSNYGTLLKGGTFTYTGIMNVMGTYATSGPYLTKFHVYTNYIVDEFGKAHPFSGIQNYEGVNGRTYKSNNNLVFIWGDDQNARHAKVLGKDKILFRQAY